MKKSYELTEDCSMDELLKNVKNDFPSVQVHPQVGITLHSKQLNSDKTGQLHHFTPIYFGKHILLPYNLSDKNNFTIYFSDEQNGPSRISSLKELLITQIQDISELEHQYFGFNKIDYKILKNNIAQQSDILPKELKSEYILTAVALRKIEYAKKT